MGQLALTPAALDELLAAVCRRIAPFWPLDRLVAVNPYHGLLELDFREAAALLERVAGARSTLPASALLSRFPPGSQARSDLEEVVAEVGAPLTAEEVLQHLEEGRLDPEGPQVRTVAEALDEVTGGEWSRFSVDHLGAFLASYFDHEHAAWQPDREASLFRSWKTEAAIDRTPEVRGAVGFRAVVRSLPEDPRQAALQAVSRLGLGQEGLDLYLHRLLMQVGGWSAYAAHFAWERELRGEEARSLLPELLAILLAFELGLYETLGRTMAEPGWSHLRSALPVWAGDPRQETSLLARILLQRATERGYQRELLAKLQAPDGEAAEVEGMVERPQIQAAFCIDVRSEVLRRHLEASSRGIETVGFAGFFGIPLELLPLGHQQATPQCPVLVEPRFRVREGIAGEGSGAAAIRGRVAQHLVERAWQSFKMGAISCFSFVGPMGLTYLPKLFTDSFGWTRPAPLPASEGLGVLADRRTFDLEVGGPSGEPTGIPLPERIELAARLLRGLSLPTVLARLVVLAGHGTSCVNNPHAGGLDCGACGGQSGETNARVAVAILSDLEVRAGLRAEGIQIPEDTIFLAARHDTTTDEVTLFGTESLPESHREELSQLREGLAAAARASRRERARRLPEEPKDVDREWQRRSRDWAEVRPEWGLAGCAAFLAAPRSRTRGRDLEGRVFLHSYSWQQDQDFAGLEAILTGPLLVATWINLQYYASAVDPHLFGSGNKALHNVVGGTLGVVEGNTGDLRVGLPWQSIHDGERYLHEPLRLTALIEAPRQAIEAVLEKHESVRRLVKGGWIHLLALDGDGVQAGPLMVK